MMSSFLYGFLLLLLCYTHDTYSFLRFPGKRPFPESSSCRLIPKDISFEANQIEITKVLGKIEVLVDKSSLEEIHYELEKLGDETAKKAYLKWLQSSYSPERKAVTSVRIFEARIPGGNRCYVKEYLPIGYLFGRRELAASRKLISRWNELSDSTESSTSPINSPFPPVPILLGSLRTDERISDPSFRRRWMKLFPKAPPPGEGNLWLVFRWDESTFRTLRTFPNLPQIIEGLDYFNKASRTNKRWRFIRKILRKSLEALDYIHRSGYTHNALSSDSMWLTTTDQLQIRSLDVRITDLGSSQKVSELGPYARTQIMEDLYQLGFIFLTLIIACFCDRNNDGAMEARAILGTLLIFRIFLSSNIMNCIWYGPYSGSNRGEVFIREHYE